MFAIGRTVKFELCQGLAKKVTITLITLWVNVMYVLCLIQHCFKHELHGLPLYHLQQWIGIERKKKNKSEGIPGNWRYIHHAHDMNVATSSSPGQCGWLAVRSASQTPTHSNPGLPFSATGLLVTQGFQTPANLCSKRNISQAYQ